MFFDTDSNSRVSTHAGGNCRSRRAGLQQVRWKSNDSRGSQHSRMEITEPRACLDIRGWRLTFEIEYLFATQTLLRGEQIVKVATLIRARLSQHSRVETCGFKRATRDSKDRRGVAKLLKERGEVAQ